MGDMLTQEEINALLSGDGDSGGDADDLVLEPDAESLEDAAALAELENEMGATASASIAPNGSDEDLEDILNTEEKDVLGEIGNISMGTAATTLFTLLSQKVLITTPKVTIKNWTTLSESYDRPCVGIKVNYTEGIVGSNILILKKHDVKIIADIMMGGDGKVDEPEELSELELSAISEAMNQMIGSSSTSLSNVIKRKIDIDTPTAMTLNFGDDEFLDQTGFVGTDVLACIAFRMEVGDLIDSEIVQIVPINFAKDIVSKMMDDLKTGESTDTAASAQPEPAPMPQQPMPQQPMQQQPMPQQPMPQPMPMPQQPMPMQPQMPMPDQQQYAYPPPQPMYGYPTMYPQPPQINAQPAQFQPLDMADLTQQKENMGIIMDVPLEVTVELGRTTRKIREILEFVPGTIVDLDKLAGEPIDILVNGKFVASGEVVVVDENFAVRVTDIVNVDKRI